MSTRSMLLSILDGERAGRVPVAPFIHVNYVRAFFGRQDIDPISDTIEVYRHFGFDTIHRNCTPAYDDVALEGENWHAESLVEKDDRGETTTTLVHTPRGDLRQVWRLNWVSEYDAEASPIEYLMKTERDLDILMDYQPPVGAIDTSPISRAKSALGEDGVTAPWVQGAFNHAGYFFRSPEDLMLDALTNPDFYGRLMAYFIERNKQIMRQYIEAGADALSCAGNIASGKMVSPAFFREFVMPYENELIDHVLGLGAKAVYHNCGYAAKLLPIYAEMKMSMYESLTPSPYGDTDLDQALGAFPPETVLSGNIDQIEFLRRATAAEIRARVREVLDRVRDRERFILATTDYFHEDTPHESIHALADACQEAGIV